MNTTSFYRFSLQLGLAAAVIGLSGTIAQADSIAPTSTADSGNTVTSAAALLTESDGAIEQSSALRLETAIAETNQIPSILSQTPAPTSPRPGGSPSLGDPEDAGDPIEEDAGQLQVEPEGTTDEDTTDTTPSPGSTTSPRPGGSPGLGDPEDAGDPIEGDADQPGVETEDTTDTTPSPGSTTSPRPGGSPGLGDPEDAGDPIEEDADQPGVETEDTTDTTDEDTTGTETRTLGRTTRTGPSYVGIGGNIGLGEGDTALGDGSFAVFSKIGITNSLSIRPAVLFSDDPTILIPVTFDFIPLITDATEDVSGALGFRASPYVGAGTAISTGDDGAVDLLLTGGVDVPLGRRFTATAAVNASLFDNPAIGLMLGAGINF